MSIVTYPNSSPYALTPQATWYLKNWTYRPLLPDSGDQLYQLESRHNLRPDTLANELYGNPSYWWIFAIRNPSLRRDPLWLFQTGIVIVVPSSEYLTRVLGG